jgi:hypothetical protein
MIAAFYDQTHPQLSIERVVGSSRRPDPMAADQATLRTAYRVRQLSQQPSTDAQDRLTDNLQTFNGPLISSPLQTTAGVADVYITMLSFRYAFQ